MPASTPNTAFFVAPFSLDGELIGIGRWALASLSPKWLAVCEDLIRDHGNSFRASFGQMLNHIEVQLTTAAGVGLGTFFAHGRIAASTAYLRGHDIAAPVRLRVEISPEDIVKQSTVWSKSTT